MAGDGSASCRAGNGRYAHGNNTFRHSCNSHVAAIITGVWIAGVLILGSGMYRQILKIQALRRNTLRTIASGYTVILMQQPIGSFSFLRTIYLREGIPEPQRSHIIAHEASHTCERLVMEGIKILFWWNPFVRIASRKLIEVHEFEADRDVLRQGYSASAYADTVFAQFFGYNPDIANGLYDSLTKKRFQMMTANSSERHSLFRLAATLPAIAGIVCTFAFTTRAAEPREPLRTPESPVATAAGTETTSPIAGEGQDKPFLIVEKMPRFEGGELNDFRNWVQAQVLYPEEALKKQLAGRVTVKFVIETDGSVSDIEIVESRTRS